MKKRIISLTLSLVLLSSLFTGCAGDKQTDAEGAPSASDEPQAMQGDPSGKDEAAEETEPAAADRIGFESCDYGGTTFTVLSNMYKPYEFNTDELTGDVVNDAVYEKDQLVMEYLGIEINDILEDGDWPARDAFNAKITQAVTAGDGTYDMVMNTMVCTMPISTQGVFLDGKLLKYADFDHPWWIADMYDRFSICGKLYGFLGDFSLSLYKDLSVIFFNKRIWKDYTDRDPYELVRNNEWVLDTFVGLCSGMSVDMNGDGQWKPEDDQITYVSEYVPGGTFQTVLELPLVEKNADGIPEFSGLTEKFAAAYEKVMAFYSNADNLHYSSIDDKSYKSQKYFAGSRVATMCNFIYSTEYLRDMDDDYGIVPMPKYDEAQQKYIAQLGTSTCMIFVPLTAPDRELTSRVMECLAFFGYTCVSPKYYEVALKEKYARDAEIHEMLDIIRAGATLDFLFVYGTSLNSAPNSMFRNYSDAPVASQFASIDKPFSKSLEKIVEAYQGIEH